MGISILTIMLYHTIGHITITEFEIHPFKALCIGVEFFLIISAIGCYFSLDKNVNLTAFYKRRIIRLFPAVYVVLLLQILKDYILHNQFHISESIWTLSLLEILKGNMHIWFIPHILICYIMMPILYQLARSNKKRIFLLILSLSVFAGLIFFDVHESPIGVSLYRYPIFIVSVLLGKYVKEQLQIRTGLCIPCVIGTIILTVCFSILSIYVSWLYLFAALFFISIPLLYFIAVVLEHVKFSWILGSLAFIGGISLEIYLTHERFAIPLARYLFPNSDVGKIIASFPLAVLAAYILHRAVMVVQFSMSIKKKCNHESK